jgi:hypothetical protein
MPLRVRKLKKPPKLAERTSSSSLESSSDSYAQLQDSTGSSAPSIYASKADKHEQETPGLCSDPRHVAYWGYILIFTSWLVFVIGLGGLLGIWDRIFGFKDGKAAQIICFMCLMSVTGFAWVLLNWSDMRLCVPKLIGRLGLKSFRMTSSKA